MSYDLSDSTKYNLWLNSGDNQCSMHGGAYDTREEAELAIPEVEAEFKNQCGQEWDEDCFWSIEDPKKDDE